VVDAFERARATEPVSARAPGELGVDPDGVGWRRLRERAIVREAEQGRYYLDIEVWRAVRRARRRMLLVLLFVMVALTISMGALRPWLR
jgi:hypothetical protein